MDHKSVEMVEDVIEKTVDTIDQTLNQMAKQKKLFIIVASVSTAVAAATGYFIGYRTSLKVLEPKYAARADEEIKEAKAFYSTLYKQGDLATPEKAAEALIPREGIDKAAEALSKYQGKGVPAPILDEVSRFAGTQEIAEESLVESSNVFVESSTDFVWVQEDEDQLRLQNPGEPYVITEEEWGEGVPGYSRITLTYYEGDNTLADEKDEAIPDVDETMSIDNLSRFGHGTGDSRTMFVRNERLQIDFEILKSDGKYAHEVLGFQHGERLVLRDQKTTLRRFRDD